MPESNEVKMYVGGRNEMTVDISGLSEDKRALFLSGYSQITMAPPPTGDLIVVPYANTSSKLTRMDTVRRLVEMIGAKPKLDMGKPPKRKLEVAPL